MSQRQSKNRGRRKIQPLDASVLFEAGASNIIDLLGILAALGWIRDLDSRPDEPDEDREWWVQTGDGEKFRL